MLPSETRMVIHASFLEQGANPFRSGYLRLLESLRTDTYNHVMTMRLTADQEAMVREALASGLAETAEEFVSSALRERCDALKHQASVQDWLRDVVVPACREFERDPAQGRSIDQVRKELLEE